VGVRRGSGGLCVGPIAKWAARPDRFHYAVAKARRSGRL
jgi:hypothetical protein